ncbi:putative toxin-antitoxin system toxin component, PIN family [Fibrella forsythiae]|uniref:Toxin-antitoxin system toxin component, PIN family n=1 Tax=Fibrella forsythiae TaxID=2817061 RepID=A0ABS3JPD1_9BACT|nr:putative toxin-antitoxin system toxin component, PIN family [Fibrella forsythiae]MBO0951864.1 putative toxin-antitoxin system toxin component, PIN family [Fibrella forsythiae]
MQPSIIDFETRIVFDTNVLISTFVFPGFSAKVYDFCVLYADLYTSEWILSELDEKMENKFKYHAERRQRISQAIRERHVVVDPTNRLPTDSVDPDDNNVLRAALFINANLLITNDEKHLLPLKRIGNTEIISPRAFYEQYIA